MQQGKAKRNGKIKVRKSKIMKKCVFHLEKIDYTWE
jgi:hypothetical protein